VIEIDRLRAGCPVWEVVPGLVEVRWRSPA
jgi:hypothetical protein